jgi:hypothetical protein
MERVTGIESALSAWEAVPTGPVTWPDLRDGVSASDRERPLLTWVNGTLMARRTEVRPALMAASWSSPVLLDSCHPSGRGRRVKAREATACGLALTRQTRPRQLSSEEEGTTLPDPPTEPYVAGLCEPYDVRLCRLGLFLVAALTSADRRRAFVPGPQCLPRPNPSRRVLCTNPCTNQPTRLAGSCRPACRPVGRGPRRSQTALAARVAAVPISSSWTNFVDRSSLDGTA